MSMAFGSDVGTSYEWRLGQRVFEVSRRNIDLNDLRFDGRNPRIRHALRSDGLDPVTADQANIRYALGKVEQDHINKLYWQIVEAGGLLSPLVVDQEGTVYEGNCRLAALQRLCFDYPEQSGFCAPPCEILPPDFDEEARLLFLGDCHVAGKQKWDAQEVAEHVYRMATQLNKPHDFIARTLRMSKTTVGRYVDAYEMHTAFLRRYPFPGNQYKWSYFYEFQKKKPLRDRRKEDPEFEEQFGRWIEEGKLRRGEEVRRLPELLEDDETLAMIDEFGLNTAWEHHQAKITVDDPNGILLAIEQATRQLETLQARDLDLFGRPNSNGGKLIQRLYERVCLVARLAQVELDPAQAARGRR